MQQVIELGRVIRDQKKKPLKVPLRGLVVVHTEPTFLEEMAGRNSLVFLGQSIVLHWMAQIPANLASCGSAHRAHPPGGDGQ